MPKLKTHKGAAKRFKKTGTGKVLRGQTKMRHILTSKATKTKRHLGDGAGLGSRPAQGAADDSVRLMFSLPGQASQEAFGLRESVPQARGK